LGQPCATIPNPTGVWSGDSYITNLTLLMPYSKRKDKKKKKKKKVAIFPLGKFLLNSSLVAWKPIAGARHKGEKIH